MGSTSPFIFIGGCGHSGTTLLLQILSQHTHITSLLGLEENKLSIFQKNNRDWKDVQKVLKMKYHGSNDGNDGNSRSGMRLIYKNPNNILFIKKIKAVYPGCKIILMYRDGRDVALSMHRQGKKGGFKECVKYWTNRTKMVLKYRGKEHNESILILRYEDLINDTDGMLKYIQEFLGVEVENLLDQYLVGLDISVKKPDNESNGKKHNQLRTWQVNQAIYNSSRWRKDMTHEQMKIFDKIGGNLYQKLGYLDNDVANETKEVKSEVDYENHELSDNFSES